MHLIEKIKSQLNIIDIIGRYVQLHKHGATWKGLCPFHEEKTPSFTVDEKNQFYKCFGCGTGGDLIKWWQDYFKIDTKTAVKELSEYAGLSNSQNNYRIERKAVDFTPKKTNYELLKNEKEFFEERAAICEFEAGLNKIESEKIAFQFLINERIKTQKKIYNSLYNFCSSNNYTDECYKYLTGEKRGLTAVTLKQFKIFEIHSIKQTNEFLRDNFSIDELIISGLITSEYEYFVFSKHKIIIPYIKNSEIAYLRGRYWNENNPQPENKTGKYIGLCNFSTNLTAKRFYNIDILKSLLPGEEIIISEGEFDSAITVQNGYRSVGIGGVSNFPKNDIHLLKNYKVFLALDNDNAGEKAAFEIGGFFDRPITLLKLTSHKDLTELFNHG